MDLPECLHAFDLWEESDTSEQEQTRALQREAMKKENIQWEIALRNAAVSNNEGEVKELLASRSASLQSDRLLQMNVAAALRLVTSERMVKAFSDASPDFFRDMWAPAALLKASQRGHQHQVALLLGFGVPADAQSPWTQMLSLHGACALGRVACARLLLAHGADVARQVNGGAPLHYAAESGSAECVEVLLNGGADVDAGDADGETALHWAAKAGAVECVRALVTRGANLEAKEGIRGTTPLLMAIRASNSEPRMHGDYLLCVKELVRLGADACATDRHGNNALFHAIMNGALDMFKYLIDGVVDLSRKNMEGETSLHIAVCGRVEFVRDLVTAGIDINCKRNDGMTPLHCAVVSWNTCCTKELVSLGADIDACNNRGWTPMHLATYERNVEMFRLLLDGGCDVTLRNNEGETPLHFAALWCSFECVKELLDRGADANAKNNTGRTPAHCAARRWHPERLEELLKHGADINARDDNGWTILHHAARGGSISIVKFAVRRGFDLESRTVENRTPLHLAAKSGFVDCVRELLRLGAFVNARDKDGRTPLHEAAQGTIHDVSELLAQSLLEGGADRLALDAEGHSPADLAILQSMQRLIRLWAIAA